jgi:hypothetical protein
VAEKPPGPPIASGLLGQILAYVDRPWRVVGIVVLFVVGGVGWVAYEQREEILESWLTPSAATLKTDDVPAALERLVDDSGADLVQIWSVDLSANSQRFIAARRRDGQRPVIPEPRRLPVIVRSSDLQVLVDVINGNPACADVTLAAPSPVVHRLAERGMQRACAIPIPPSPDAFVGVIYITWVRKPDHGAEEVALVAAREISGTLVSR